MKNQIEPILRKASRSSPPLHLLEPCILPLEGVDRPCTRRTGQLCHPGLVLYDVLYAGIDPSLGDLLHRPPIYAQAEMQE